MYFCSLCSSILFTEQSQNIILTCPSCPYVYRVTENFVDVVYNGTKKAENIISNSDELKYANKCDARCPKCSHDKAMFMEIQTRSADEPATIFYQCLKCRFDWKE